MIGFRDPAERASSTVIIISILAILGCGIYYVIPKQSAAELTNAKSRSQLDLKNKIEVGRNSLAKAKEVVAAHTMERSIGEVSPAVLERVSALAKEVGIDVSGFRPQKLVPTGDMTMLPVILTVQGPYPKVVAFVRSLEQPNNKLAVTLVQVASSDGSSDAVTGTVGLSVFVLPPPAKTAKVAEAGEPKQGSIPATTTKASPEAKAKKTAPAPKQSGPTLSVKPRVVEKKTNSGEVSNSGKS